MKKKSIFKINSFKKKVYSTDSFKEWRLKILKQKIKIKKILISHFISRKDSDYNIFTIDTKLIFNKKIYRRAIQFEGTSVAIVPLLFYKKKVYTILVKQFRAPMAGYSFEFPSGRAQVKDLKLSAKKELFEETGLLVDKRHFIKLNPQATFMLPANNFAKVNFYCFKKKINLNFFNNFQNKLAGENKAGEFTQVKIVDFNKKLLKSQNASTILGYSLAKNFVK
jgi:8-oxo-dGTP pyrophosphatase MutT (NUDIX family)